jgi:tRNA threonylcarbamoyladenosine biosynthesis protein TsaE
MKSFLSKSPAQTQKMGRELARIILKGGQKKSALVLALVGDLGGGKTTFLQGFAKGLGIEEKILSPTFVIMKRFRLKKAGFENFYHLDCYRIKNSREILELSFKEDLLRSENIIAVEWSEKIADILPAGSLEIKFKFLDNKKRKIIISK